MKAISYQPENGNPKPVWVVNVRDLPAVKAKVKAKVSKLNGESHFTYLGGRKRQVIEALKEGPVFCASCVRLSDAVFRLKEDCEIDIATKRTELGRKFYELTDVVDFVDQGARP